MAAPETIYFEDKQIVISSEKVKLGVNVFNLRNMSSVSIVEKMPLRFPWILLALAGFFVAAFFLGKYGYPTFTSIVSVILFFIGIAMTIFPKKKYIIRVVSSGIATDGFTSTNHKYAKQIESAINEALDKRG
jgi:hypothetical protein